MTAPLPTYGTDPWEEHRRRRRRIGLVFLGVVLAIAVLFVVLLYERGTAGSGGGPYFFPWWGFFGIFFLLWIAFFAVRVAFWTTRGSGSRRYNGGGPHQNAWAIARQRYARGEITREQYQQIMNDLRQRPGPP